jgi:hypothetical protein
VARILVTDVFYMESDGGFRGPGFLVIQSGSVTGKGLGEPPPEAQYAEMVVGGDHRVAVPSFASPPLLLEAYALRMQLEQAHCEGCVTEALKAVAKLSAKQAYYSSLVAAYELTLMGVTRIIAVSTHPSSTVKAIEDAGAEGVVLVPRGCGVEVDVGELQLDAQAQGRVKLGVLSCSRAEGVELGDVVARLEPDGAMEIQLPDGRAVRGYVDGVLGRGMILPVYPWRFSPWAIMALSGSKMGQAYYWLMARDLHKLFDEGYRVLEGKAQVLLLDLSEPPCWVPSLKDVRPWALCAATPRIELLVSGDRIVVDSGHHMFIGPSALREAALELSSL